MPLTPAQLELRTRGIGASEWSAILGLNPWSTELDVWPSKWRGPGLTLAPYVDPVLDAEAASSFAPIVKGSPMAAGNALEDGIVALYEKTCGVETRRVTTRAHRKHKWLLATPDRVGRDPRLTDRTFARGNECKLVGAFTQAAWRGETLPVHVWVQCQANMAVWPQDVWDVAVLLGGTTFRVHRVPRDRGFIQETIELLEEWWVRHILGNEPPEPRDGADLSRLTHRRWPVANDTVIDLSERPDLLIAVPVMKRLGKLQKAIAKLKKLHGAERAKMEALCAENSAIVGPAGRFTFQSFDGNPMWKAIAEELAGGPVPDDLLEKYAGKAFRKSQFHPFSTRKDRK